MKKNDLLEAWLISWETSQSDFPESAAHKSEFRREYRAFFFCFNDAQFYEAHDVLEHLWLRCSDANRSYYQALIQLAGAFVHFQKQALFPDHPTHARRVAPGRRLLALARQRFQSFPSWHLGVDVEALCSLCTLWDKQAAATPIPLQTFAPPQLPLPSAHPVFSKPAPPATPALRG